MEASRLDSIAISMDPSLLTAVAGGEPVEATVTLENRSRIVDHYELQLEGLEPSWYDVPSVPTELMPGERAQVRLTFHPPLTLEAAAGAHSFTVRATSRNSPDRYSSLVATLDVQPFGAITMEMNPQRLEGRKGLTWLAIANRSNASVDLTLRASDLEEGLEYRFSADTVTLPAAGQEDIELKIRPKRRPRFGDVHEYQFRVEALEEGAGETSLAADGTFAYQPPLASVPVALGALWRGVRRALPILVPLLVLLFILGADVKAAIEDAGGGLGPPRITHLRVVPSEGGILPGGLALDYGMVGDGSTNAKGVGLPIGSDGLLVKAQEFEVNASGPEGQDKMDLDVALTGPPVVMRFLTSSKQVNFGESARLEWLLVGAQEADINGIAVAADQAKAGAINSPPIEKDTVFVLTAGNGAGKVSSYVVAESVPVIDLFVAEPVTITAGDPTTLRWQTRGATGATIDVGVGEVDINGSKVVSPSGSTDYTLVATNSYGRSAKAVASVSTISPAVIGLLEAKPPVIALGKSSVLSWQTEGATTVSFDHGIGVVDPKGTKPVAPTENTTYTLSAANSVGTVVTRTATVTVVPPPQISCSVDPDAITAGDTARLSWQSSGADIVSIDQGIGAVEAQGSRTVSPGQTTTYAFTASNLAGPTACGATLTVVPVPQITSFAANPATIPQKNTSTLSWQTTGASTVSIDQGIGPVNANGSRQVSPVSTTTYTLSASNSLGRSTTRTATVTVIPPPTIIQFSGTGTPGGTLTLSWQTQNATSASIDQGIGSVAVNGQRTIRFPLGTTTYNLTASNQYSSANRATTVEYPVKINSLTGAWYTSSCYGSYMTWNVSGGTDARLSMTRQTISSGTTNTIFANRLLSSPNSYCDGTASFYLYSYTLTIVNSLGHTDTGTATVDGRVPIPFLRLPDTISGWIPSWP